MLSVKKISKMENNKNTKSQSKNENILNPKMKI